MSKAERMKLLERLVKDGNITLSEAFDLLQPEKEYVYYPNTYLPYTPIFGSHVNTEPSSIATYSTDKLEELYKNQYPGEFPGPTKL